MSGLMHTISAPDAKTDHIVEIAALWDGKNGFHKRLVGIIQIDEDNSHSVWFRVTSNDETVDESQSFAQAIRVYNGL